MVCWPLVQESRVVRRVLVVALSVPVCCDLDFLSLVFLVKICFVVFVGLVLVCFVAFVVVFVPVFVEVCSGFVVCPDLVFVVDLV